MFWLIVIIVALIIEMVNMGIFFVWPAIGALIAYISFILGANVLIQIILFVIISVALLIVVRPHAVHIFQRGQAKSRRQGLVGMDAVVITEINNLRGTGLVAVDNSQWTAEAHNLVDVYKVGDVVKVVKIADDKLYVKGKPHNRMSGF